MDYLYTLSGFAVGAIVGLTGVGGGSLVYANTLYEPLPPFYTDRQWGHITDWKDARMVPLSEGRFDLDDYIDYIIDMVRFLGEDTHVLAVCQPSVPVLAAVALMEASGDRFAPATMTLMGGPIDTRINPTAVNRLAEGLRVEARAPDGLVEAFSDPRAAGFNLCVQWHPEFFISEGDRALYAAFIAAAAKP